MKVLVLSCSTGGGHNSCGKYIKEEFNLQNIECDFVDYFSLLGNKLSKRIEKLYLKSTRGKGKIFESVYKLGETYSKVGLTSPVYELNKLAKNKVLDFIQKNEYDFVVCPHLFPAMAITALKKENVPIQLVNVATDYTNIPFWNETLPDYFVIPHASLKEEFTSKGIDEKVLLPFGIPISTRFQQARNLPFLKKDKPHILVTSGSMGFGNVKDIVVELLRQIDAYVVVICGNNKKLYHQLEKIKNKNLILEGFVENMNDYLYSCEVILTKPGGLTSTEVAVLNRPMVHLMPIPGVENHNAHFFEKHHLSLVSNTVEEVLSNTKKILEDENLQQEMMENQKKWISKNAAHNLVLFLKEKEALSSKKEEDVMTKK